MTDHHAIDCNAQRAQCAEQAVEAYADVKVCNTTDLFDFSSQDAQDRLCDLLTDLRHFARANELDFEAADTMAAIHFDMEVEEEDGDEQEGATS